MSNKSLIEQLKFWRAERPDEWTMDEFIRGAEKLEQQCNELATQVERLRSRAFSMLMNRTGLDEWYDLEKIYTETPPSALSALKAQCQAEAINSAADFLHDHSIYISERYLRDFAAQIINRAQEPSNANTDNPPA